MKHLIAGMILCIGVGLSAYAESISIGEADFEGAPNRGNVSVLPWKKADGSSTIGIESYSTLGTDVDAVPGGGTYCHYNNNASESIYQVLSANLAANTVYTLSAVAIDRSNQTFQPSELRLGYVPGTDSGTTGDMVANDFFGEYLLTATVLTNTTPVNGAAGDDGYVTWSSTFTTVGSPAGVGFPIRIEIVGSGVQSLFDNVALSAEFIPVPSISSLDGAAGITATNALLYGELTSTGGAPTTVFCYWNPNSDPGENTAGWMYTNSFGVADGLGKYTNDTADTAALTPSTQYYYRYCATNSFGTNWSDAVSFWTYSAPEVSNSTGAVPESVTSATLYGELSAGGGAAAWLCWATNDAGTSATSDWDNVVSIGFVSQGEAFSTNVTGLATNTTYFYRCYVTSLYGTDWSDDSESFSGTPAGGTGGGGDIVSGAELNFDANNSASGIDDDNWNSLTANSTQDFDFGADVTLESVSSSETTITNAYRFTGGAGDANNTSWDGLFGDGSATTWELWLKPDDTGDGNQVVYESGGSGRGYAIWYAVGTPSDGTGTFHFTIDGGVDLQIETVSAEIDVSDFRQISLTSEVDGSGTIDVLKIYVDGALVDDNLSATLSDDVGNDNDNSDISDWCGANGTGLGNANDSLADAVSDGEFDGDIAVFRVWPSVLTAAEISINYLAMLPGGSTIANLAPTGITDSAASLNASLDATGTNYALYVYYGNTDGGTNAGAWASTNSLGSYTDVSTNVSYAASLSPDQTWYYTFMASNTAGVTWAEPSWRFSTLPANGIQGTVFKFR
jgi:hypothetical protein